jgi:hypothetical protein
MGTSLFNHTDRSVLHVLKSQAYLCSAVSISSRMDLGVLRSRFAPVERLPRGQYIPKPNAVLPVDPNLKLDLRNTYDKKENSHRWCRCSWSPTRIPWNWVLDLGSSLCETPKAMSEKRCSLVNATIIEIKTLELQSNTNASVNTLICISHPFVGRYAGLRVCTCIHPWSAYSFACDFILQIFYQ